jgi:hypothetical protein
MSQPSQPNKATQYFFYPFPWPAAAERGNIYYLAELR